MKQNTYYLLDLYNNKPNLDDWDYMELYRLLNMEIYIINSDNIITHSSFRNDIGLDFSKCCQKLAKVLDERRATGGFYADGMDIEQESGEIKKYSYMVTDDKQYIIQLSYSLQNGPVFNGFNFLNTIDKLVEEHPSINEINVLNIGGLALGDPQKWLTKERSKAFEQTLTYKQETELKGSWNNEESVYRYVHYISDFDEGSTKNKVIEIVYNDRELQAVLSKVNKTFFVQLLFIIFIIGLIALIIHNWVHQEVYLANHDSLTELKNRAAFDELVTLHLSKDKGQTALLMIDLDNFKSVNPIKHQISKPQIAGKLLELEFGVLIGITGDLKGKLVLSGPTDVFGSIGESMFGEVIESTMLKSFSGELGNIIAGSLSTIIVEKGVKTDITYPTILQGNTTISGHK